MEIFGGQVCNIATEDLLITTYILSQDTMQNYQLGVDMKVISKPFSFSLLEQQIRSLYSQSNQSTVIYCLNINLNVCIVVGLD